LKTKRRRPPLQASIGRFELGRREISTRQKEPVVVRPIDPGGRMELDLRATSDKTSSVLAGAGVSLEPELVERLNRSATQRTQAEKLLRIRGACQTSPVRRE
jgi:hypothetical protein